LRLEYTFWGLVQKSIYPGNTFASSFNQALVLAATYGGLLMGVWPG